MYQIIGPPEHLKKYVDCFWFGDDHDLPGKPNTHHAIATSKMELLFFCAGRYAVKDGKGIARNVFEAGFYGQTTSYDHFFSQRRGQSSLEFGFLHLPYLRSSISLNVS